jgi:hypothetical protein
LRAERLNLAANLLPNCLANLPPTENMKLQRKAFKYYRIRVRGHNTGSPSLLFPGQLWSPRLEGALFMMTKIYITIATPGGVMAHGEFVGDLSLVLPYHR